jgi:spermidine synthase
MYKYSGVLVYQSHDDEGILEVVEREGVRSLHFGSYPRQSSMILSDPDALALEYVRTMCSWLLFKDGLDDEALLLGLGGGSITKHLLYHFQGCRLKVIEFRNSVVKIARSHFGLPLDPRLKIIIDDAGAYLRQRSESHQERYSLLISDAFDHAGMAESLCNKTFFFDCQRVLKHDGIMVINLWGGTSDELFQQSVLWLGQAFDWRILLLPVVGRGNIIGLAFNEGVPMASLKALRERALALEDLYNIEFTTFLKEIKKHNSSTISKIIGP